MKPMERRWYVALLAGALLAGGCPDKDKPAPGNTGTRPGAGGGAVALTPLVEKELAPSAQAQAVEVKGRVKVIVPGGLLKRKATLKIAAASGQPAPLSKAYSSLGAFEVSLGDVHVLDREVQIEIPVDAARLRKDCPPQACLGAAWYDEKARTWVEVPAWYNPQAGVLVIRTSHLSLLDSWYIGAWSYWLAPGGNHGVFYDPAAVRAATAGYQARNPSTNPNVPDYVSDISAFAKAALETYARNGLKPYQDPARILVIPQGNPEYGWSRQRVYIPCGMTNPDILQYSVSHELFHAVEHANYYRYQADEGRQLWWLEAAAEYASSRVAMKNYSRMGKLDELMMSPRYLILPISCFGKTTDSDVRRYHQYQTAYFVEYVCRQKSPGAPQAFFLEMYKDLAARSGTLTDSMFATADALPMFEDFLRARGEPDGAAGLYRQYALYYLFDPQSPMHRGGVTDGQVHPKAINKSHTLAAGRRDPLAVSIPLNGSHTAQVDEIRPTVPRGKDRLGLSVELRDKRLPPGTAVYLLRAPRGDRTKREIVGSFTAPADADKSVTTALAADESLYVVAVNDAHPATALDLLVRPAEPPAAFRSIRVKLEMYGKADVTWGDGTKVVDDYAVGLNLEDKAVQWDPKTNAFRLSGPLAGTPKPGIVSSGYSQTGSYSVGGTITLTKAGGQALVNLTVTRDFSEPWSSMGGDFRFRQGGKQSCTIAAVALPLTRRESGGGALTFAGNVPAGTITATHSSWRHATNASRNEEDPGKSYTKAGGPATRCFLAVTLSEAPPPAP